MRLPVFLSTIAILAVEWVAGNTVSSNSTVNRNRNDEVLNYFGNLLPVANYTILYELGGPHIGAAVSQHFRLLAQARPYFLI